jgi:four helix bundle protein
MGTVRDYKDLAVWQRGMGLVKLVYAVTVRLPAHEQFGLVSQIRRAAVSVPSNIAEGYGRQATGEYRHHLSFARGSLLELETQILVCINLGFLKVDECDEILSEVNQLSRMMATLIAKLG